MKKVLSVAMASAMVLGMGANAFAIQYSSGSSDTAAWPTNFKFEGNMFVTNKNGDIVSGSNTKLDGKTRINFQEGDTIWMPLYADNQKEYTVVGDQQGLPAVAAGEVTFNPVLDTDVTEELVAIDSDTGAVLPFEYRDNQNKIVYWYNPSASATYTLSAADQKDNWRAARIVDYKDNYGKTQHGVKVMVNGKEATSKDDIITTGVAPSYSDAVMKYRARYVTSTGNMVYYIYQGRSTATLAAPGATVALDGSWLDKPNGGAYAVSDANFSLTWEEMDAMVPAGVKDAAKAKADTTISNLTMDMDDVVVGVGNTKALKDGVEVVAYLPEVAEVKEDLGDVTEGKWETDGNYFVNTVKHGHYTGNIDKNWSINLIEEDNGVAELVEKAELYKADEVDYLSYKDVTSEIMPNAVYLKVQLKDTWKLAKAADMKYYVYVADNKSNNNVTNKVWVSGKYEASNIKDVDFTWTNDASKPAVWKVKDGENGIAVFDFADKAFFSVKMYAGETMYLDLATAYDKAIAGEMDAEADSFYKFDNENANFSRTGELVIVSNDETLVPYEIDADGNFVKVDAEYVENYAVAHTNQKVNGFKFNTKQLGNYVLSTEELGEEEEVVEEPTTEEPVVEEPAVEEPVVEEETNKPNPNTGAEDFVGLAVSLAVVSVAAAGALALKK